MSINYTSSTSVKHVGLMASSPGQNKPVSLWKDNKMKIAQFTTNLRNNIISYWGIMF